MINPTPLSPAAQAVLDAFYKGGGRLDCLDRFARYDERIAAALRAAADQVAPSDLDEPRNYLPMAMECQRIRADLLAIAAELEGTNPSESD